MKSIITAFFALFLVVAINGQVIIQDKLPGTKTWKWGSPNSITLKPGFSYKPVDRNFFHAYIANENVTSNIIFPEISEIKLYEKLELGIKLPSHIESLAQQFVSEPYFKRGINPYDPDQIDLFAYFTSPSGVQYKINGFYYKEYDRNGLCKCNVPDCGDQYFPCWKEKQTEYNWRIRYSPNEIGTWKYNLYLIVDNHFYIGDEKTFFCNNSDNKGFIYASGDRFRYIRDNEIFVPIGMDVEFGKWGNNRSAFTNYDFFFNEISENGGNTASFALINFVGLDIEWEHLGIYENPNYEIQSSERQANRQAHAWEIDNIIDLAKTYDLKIKFTMLYHDVFEKDTLEKRHWKDNPYNLHNTDDPMYFFSNDTTISIYNKKIRYIIARWGYSTNILWWELFTEIDNIAKSSYSNNIVYNWFDALAKYVKTLDPNHMISGSYAGFNNVKKKYWVWKSDYCDIINLHSYNRNKKANLKRLSEIKEVKRKLPNNIHKPVIYGEMGAYDCIDALTDVQFHNSLWATSFSGCAGPGLNWYWDYMLPKGYAKHFGPLKEFLDLVDFNKYWMYKRFPRNFIFHNKNYRVENIYMNEHNQNSSVGWIHNATNYWYNLGLPPLYDPSGTLIEPDDDDDYSKPEVDPDDRAKIAGLKILTEYVFTPYCIMDDYTLQEQSKKTIRSNIAGQIRIKTHEYFSISNDFAYTMSLASKSYQNSINFQPDTLFCPIDTLYFEGIYNDDTLGILQYFWTFGNGDTATIAHPQVYYSNPGTYTVQLIVSDTINQFADTLSQNFVVMACDTTQIKSASIINDSLPHSKQIKVTDEADNFKVYPNPTKGNFVLIGEPVTEQLHLVIYNNIGQIVWQSKQFFSGKINISLENFPKGVYLLKISNGKQLKTIKIMKI